MVDLQPILAIAEAPPLHLGDGGVLLIGKTRVPVDTVIGAFLDGDSAETIADCFDVLALSEVYAVIAFYLAHREQVDFYLKERHEASLELRQHIESQPGYREGRERLLARGRERGLRR